MASRMHSPRHTAAQTTILIWLGGFIAIAGIAIVLAYHVIRGHALHGSRIAARLHSAVVAESKPASAPAPSETAQEHRSAVVAASKDAKKGD